MRQKLLLALLVVIQSLFCNLAAASHTNIHAHQNGYFGLSGTTLDDGAFSVSGAALIAGFDLNQFFAVESQVGFVSEDTESTATSRLKTQINYFSTVRLRVNYHMRKMIPYFYLGYTGMNVTSTATTTTPISTTTTDSSEAGFSYGLGIDLFGNQNTSIFLSTGVLLKDSDINLRSTIIGFRYYLSRKRPTIFH